MRHIFRFIIAFALIYLVFAYISGYWNLSEWVGVAKFWHMMLAVLATLVTDILES